MTTETRTIASFMSDHGITGTVEEIGERTDGVRLFDHPGTRHFLATFTREGKSGWTWEVEWSQGSAVQGEPELRQIFASVVQDVAGVEEYDGDQSAWLEEFGYLDGTATTHGRGLSAWELIQQHRDDLIAMLGGERYLFDELLYETTFEDDE